MVKDYFNYDNLNLPMLLRRAAIEVDNYIIGKSESFGSTYELQGLIERSLKSNKFSPTDIKLFSPSVRRYVDKKITKVTEFIEGLELIVNDISEVSIKPKEKLESIRNFFTNSCHELICYQQSMYGRHQLV